MKTFLTLATIVLALALAAGAASKNICQVKRLSTNEVGISCANGADPTGVKIGETVVMSCGTP